MLYGLIPTSIDSRTDVIQYQESYLFKSINALCYGVAPLRLVLRFVLLQRPKFLELRNPNRLAPLVGSPRGSIIFWFTTKYMAHGKQMALLYFTFSHLSILYGQVRAQLFSWNVRDTITMFTFHAAVPSPPSSAASTSAAGPGPIFKRLISLSPRRWGLLNLLQNPTTGSVGRGARVRTRRHNWINMPFITGRALDKPWQRK